MAQVPIQVIGKAYNRSTQNMMAYLEQRQLSYTFSDLDYDIHLWDFIRKYKIKSIPVMAIRGYFVVGYDEATCRKFLFHMLKTENNS